MLASEVDNPDFQQGYREFWETTWGSYPHKPAAQEQWDKQVKLAALHIARLDKQQQNAHDNQDTRPRIFDINTKSWFLVDTGASVSIVPHSWYPRNQPDAGRALQAVNGTRIATYGVRNLDLRLGHTYNHTFIVSEV